MIIEINLNKLIDQIIAHVINHHFKNKNKNKKVKSLNADNKINNSKSKSNSNLNQGGQTDQVNVNKFKSGDDKRKQLNNNQLNNDKNNINNNQSDSGRQSHYKHQNH